MDQKILIKRGIKDTSHLNNIDVIIVSVNYNDFLQITLENNVKIFKSITVVTTINDLECQKICEEFNVNCIITERIYENGASFNKGKAINDGIKSLLNPNWILLLDADIIVPDTFTESFKVKYTNINSLYICDRVMYKEYVNYLDWKSGLGEKGPTDIIKGMGYFQLFNINGRHITKIVYPEGSNNAAGSDISFRNRFTEKVDLKIESIHLGASYENWNGREPSNPIKEVVNTTKYKICSYYFNIKNDPRLKDNFLKFIKQFEGRYDNLIVGLVDYGDIDFELPCETIVIKGDVDNKIWSKEIIINKIIDTIDNTDYLMWIDGDLIYNNLSWLDNIDDVVNNNDFVQLFEDINYLNEEGETTHSYKSICFKLKDDLKSRKPVIISKYENKSDFKPGGAWLGKLSILKEKKFFEKMYVGGGDVIFLYGLNDVNEGFTLNKVKESNEEIYNEAIDWLNSFGKRYNLGYLNQTVNHLYHGEMSERNYIGRYKKLSKFSTTPVVFQEENFEIKIKNNSILNKGLINRIFDKVYCLNLDRRVDRWKSMQDKFNYLGIKADRFSATDGDKIDNEILIKYSINKYAVGCLLSHYEIIKDAKKNKYKNILILEDDILFSQNFLEEFENKIKTLGEWKMIYLGSSQYDWDVDISNGFYKSKNTLGTFAYAINESLYDEILGTNNIINTPIDNILSTIQEINYGHCHTFYPNIIIADVSESDIRENRIMDKHSKKMRWEIDKFKKIKPFFSIIIPTYNSKYLIETLDSIQSQTIDDYECIIVDDGSVDDLSKIHELYRNTKIYKRPDYLNKNANSCRNYGVYMSKGEYIIFLDSDDCLSKNCLEDRKNEINKNKSFELHIFKMGRFSKYIGDNNQLVNKKSIKNKLVDDFLSYNILWPITSSSWRREILYKLGGFDENLNRFQDFDMHIRFLLSSSNCIIHEESNIDCYYRNSEFHINITDERKKLIINSAEYLIEKYYKHGVIFNKEFFNYLKKRYNYESNIYKL